MALSSCRLSMGSKESSEGKPWLSCLMVSTEQGCSLLMGSAPAAAQSSTSLQTQQRQYGPSCESMHGRRHCCAISFHHKRSLKCTNLGCSVGTVAAGVRTSILCRCWYCRQRGIPQTLIWPPQSLPRVVPQVCIALAMLDECHSIAARTRLQSANGSVLLPLKILGRAQPAGNLLGVADGC